MRILLVEPFFGGSHRYFVDVVSRFSAHDLHTLTLPARFWKWRLSGSPFVLAPEFAQLPTRPDLLIFANTIDVAAFLALAGPAAMHLPSVVFFHENQITYPRSAQDVPDAHYGLINLTSMLATTETWFNSDYQKRELFAAIPPFLRQFPDFIPGNLLEKLAARASVLGLPIEPLPEVAAALPKGSALRILWNHRWEYDKGPEDFFAALERLVVEGVPFEVILLGEGFRRTPPVFDRAREMLGARLVRFGYCEDRKEYASWVRSADLVVSCAQHEFFGVSVAEAVLAGCFPILPNRLVYPDFIPKERHAEHLFGEAPELVGLLRQAARHVQDLRRKCPLPYYDSFKADKIVRSFDERCETLLESFREKGLGA